MGRDVATAVLVAIALVLVMIVDAILWPHRNLAILYAIPVLIGALRASPRAVLAIAVVATIIDVVDIVVENVLPGPWPVSLVGLWIVCAFGVLIAVQREELVRRTHALAEAREGITTILDRMTDAFYAVDTNWHVTYLNREAAQFFGRVLGRAPETIVDKSIWEVFPEAQGTPFERELRHALRDNVTVVFESFSHAAGVWFEIHAYPGTEGLSVYLRDVTARKQAEEERERLLTREQAVADIAQTLVRETGLERIADVVISQSLNVLGADTVALWLADPTRRQLTLLAERNVSHEAIEKTRQMSYDASFIAAQTARTEQIQVVEDLSTSGVSPEAQQFYIGEGLRSLLDVPLISRGHLVGVVSYAYRTPRRFTPQDVQFNRTVADLFAVAIENARLYDQVRQTLRLREEFMAAAAHELKTPVTVIKGRTQWLLRTDTYDERVRDVLENVVRQSDRIALLIENLLSVLRLQPGPSALERERFDLRTVTRRLVARIAPTAPEHDFRVKDPAPLLVDADPDLIGEVITRLLENALRYTPQGGPIEVEARRDDREAVVSISDHGVGIALDRQPHVFEPFYQLVPPGVPGYVGIVSLGLYLSKQIVEVHGGRMWFTSTPGKGSTFWFSLPLAEAAA